MADLRLDSPATFRAVAVAAATVASLGLVALGVQIGTHGLGSDGPERNAASATASPAAAVVDLPRTRPASGLEQALLSLIPGEGVGAFVPANTSVTTAGFGPTASSPVAPAPGPGPSQPAPAPAPSEPVPVPSAPVLPAPTPVPDPSAVLDPLAPIVDPVVAPLTDPLATTVGSTNDTAGTALVPTVTSLLGF